MFFRAISASYVPVGERNCPSFTNRIWIEYKKNRMRDEIFLKKGELSRPI